jgi:tetratricopeptide (TPR) repeat protein
MILHELLEQGAHERAKAEAVRRIKEQPGHGEALAVLARLALEEEDPDTAQAMLTRVVPRERSLYEVMLAEAWLQNHTGQQAAARVAFAHLTSLAPQRPEAFFALGCSLLERGDVDAAERALSQAVALAPERAIYEVAHAEALIHGGRFADAVGVLMSALGHAPTRVEAYVGLSLVLQKTGHPAQAIEVVERGLKAVPMSPRLWAERFRLRFLAGDGETEREADGFPGGRAALAEVLCRDAPEVALSVCDLGQGPARSAALLFIRGRAFEALGEVEEALDSYGRAMEVDSRDWRPASARGTLLMEAFPGDESRLFEAGQCFEAAVARSERSVAEPLLLLADWHRAKGDITRAKALVDEILRHGQGRRVRAKARAMRASLE